MQRKWEESELPEIQILLVLVEDLKKKRGGGGAEVALVQSRDSICILG